MNKIDPSHIIDSAIDAAIASLKSHGYEEQVKHAARLFADAFKARGETTAVTLITPTGKSGELKDAITQVLETSLGRAVMMTELADPSLIAGAVLVLGSERIDLSAKGALKDLETRMRSNS